MTHEQALAYWFGRINYEQRTPQPSDLKLDRMRAMLRLLGDPQQDVRIGADVEAVFEPHDEEKPPFTLVQWKLA